MQVFYVDTFADKPFTGSSAVVCVLPGPRGEEWMLAVAREFHMPATAFLFRFREGFNLRWFTPLREMDLCGDATLAATHVLQEAGYLDQNPVVQFYTCSGALTGRQRDRLLALDLPSTPAERTNKLDVLENAFGVTARSVRESRFFYLVEVDSEECLGRLVLDPAGCADLPPKRIVATCGSPTSDVDYLLRVFSPHLGLVEDPDLASAQCCLAILWKSRLNKMEFVAKYATARGGLARVRTDAGRVQVCGQAVTVLRGDFTAHATESDRSRY